MQRLAFEFMAMVDGDPWFGSPLTKILEGVDSQAAGLVPQGLDHSIWSIVAHMTSWVEYMATRMLGAPPSAPADGDWPELPAADAEAWDAAVARLLAAHRHLADVLSGIPDDHAGDPLPGSTPEDAGGVWTLHRYALGGIQHSVFHAGQIAVLKKLVRGETEAP